MNDLLKFITCGSVDDGKSTLIGHLLYDAKLIYADQKEALLLDSKIGSRGGARLCAGRLHAGHCLRAREGLPLGGSPHVSRRLRIGRQLRAGPRRGSFRHRLPGRGLDLGGGPRCRAGGRADDLPG